MRIIITGAGGFVGRRLIEKLPSHDIVGIDTSHSSFPDNVNVTEITGDLCEAGTLKAAFSEGCDAVIHLATIPGGAAEQNPALAKKINIDATMKCIDYAASLGSCPRFIFASSIAVFGDTLPNTIDDNSPTVPKMLYGGHKLMMEQWIATLTRRGVIDGISLRLSGVVARPKGPSGMKSAYLSDVFHDIKANKKNTIPVSKHSTCWLSSVNRAASNFIHALSADLSTATPERAITLPTLRVTMEDMVTEIARQTGTTPSLVSYKPDSKLEAAFGSQPPVTTHAADKLGFKSDQNLTNLVKNTLNGLR
ncbi:MAG: NAD-dependent epimerase/dehydratase family protein [Gammaproteobacteria bacterium]